MSRVLIVYGTREGHTAKIAARVAHALRTAGHDTDVFDVGKHPSEADPSGYDAVIVGASVHVGSYEREVRTWVRTNASALSPARSAFFSVSLAAANRDAASTAEVEEAIARFEEQTGWRPDRVAQFGGALVYSQYNWFLRRVMRRIVRKKSDDRYTDMSRDYDLTDYGEVERFANEFAASLTCSPSS